MGNCTTAAEDVAHLPEYEVDFIYVHNTQEVDARIARVGKRSSIATRTFPIRGRKFEVVLRSALRQITETYPFYRRITYTLDAPLARAMGLQEGILYRW